jgi:tetratricopeptide (TPR) repeat protein
MIHWLKDKFPQKMRMEVKILTNKTNRKEIKFNALTVIFFLIFGAAEGQKIDSLKALLDAASGLERCDILYQLAYEYVEVDNHLGRKYAVQAFRVAEENDDSLRIVRIGRIMSLAYHGLGQVDSAIFVLDKILPVASKNKYEDELSKILNVLGLAHTYRAEYDKALGYHFQSLQMRKEKKDNDAIGRTLNNIGLVYYKMKDYDKALSFYKESLVLKSKAKDEPFREALLVNISLCYAYGDDFVQAKSYVEQALKSCNSNCPKKLRVFAFYSLGVQSYLLNNLSDAEAQFLTSYDLAKDLNDQRLLLDNIIFLSKIHIHLNQLIRAEEYLNEANELIKAGVPYNLELIKVYHELFQLYFKRKSYEKVATYQNLYIQLKDSIYNEEHTRNLMQLEADYLERENRTKIESQSKIMALNSEVIYRQRFLNTSIGLVAGLLAVLAFVLIRSNRRKKWMNRLLEQKVKERTIELERNQEALKRLLDEHSLRFQKISADVKNSLATISGLCLLSLKDTDAPFTSQYISRIEKTSDQLLRTVSIISKAS